MKPVRQFLAVAAATVSASMAFAQSASPGSGSSAATTPRLDSENPTVLAGDALSNVGTILSIDRERRDVTLGTDGGGRLVVRIGKDVGNFDKLKVGDRISVTLGEAIAVAPARGRAAPMRIETQRTAQPAESDRVLIRKVERKAMMAKVIKVDKEGKMATLRSAGGDTFVVSLEGQEHLPEMKEGSQIAVVHVETMAVTEAPGGIRSRTARGPSAEATASPVSRSEAGAEAANDTSVGRLQKAAQDLQAAAKAVASRAEGEDRARAISRAQAALSRAQEALEAAKE
jgi:hypothetical protein